MKDVEIDFHAHAEGSGDRSDYIVYCIWRPFDPIEPVYIGMGRPKRPSEHRVFALSDRPAKDYHNKRLILMYRQAFRLGLEPRIEVLADGLSVFEAIEREIASIIVLGRKDLGTGPLYNLTAGGQVGGWDEECLRAVNEKFKQQGYPNLRRGREAQKAAGYPNLKTAQPRGVEARKANGYESLKRGRETVKATGYKCLERGRETQRKNGYQAQKEYQESQREFGFPALSRAREALELNGNPGAARALANSLKTNRANDFENLKRGREVIKALGYPNMKAGHETKSRNARAMRQARRATSMGATRDQVEWLVARWRDPITGCSMSYSWRNKRSGIAEHDLSDEALSAEIELALTACHYR